MPLTEVVFAQEGPGLRKWQWTDSGMKVINVTNILGDGSVDTSNTSRYISLDEFERRYSRFAVREGDVVVASSGNTYGKVGRIAKEDLPLMMNTSVIRLHSADPSRLVDDYLYAFLRSAEFRDQVEQFVIGSAQPNFGPSHLKLMYISLPPLAAQLKIAGIISPYDDLIYNNTRRIAVLEETARLLYREWFVEFRFPRHDRVRVIDSSLGPIPDGWDVVEIGEITEVMSRGPSLDYTDSAEGVPVLNQRCVRDGSIELAAIRMARPLGGARTKCYLQPRDILINSMGIGTLGRVARNLVIDRPMIIHNCITFVRADTDKMQQLLLYYLISDLGTKFESMATGSTGQTSLPIEVVARSQVVRPPRHLQDQFVSVVGPLSDKIGVLSRQSDVLRRTRDLLLPRLISGELSVEDLDIAVEDGAA